MLPTETWVSVSPGMRRDHQCLLRWGDSCSLVSSPPFPTSSFSFPSFKRRECQWGLQLLCSPLPQGRGQINGSCVEPDWGCYSEGRKPDDSREGVCSGWGGGADTPEGRAGAGRKLSKMLSEADRDISAALPSPFC